MINYKILLKTLCMILLMLPCIAFSTVPDNISVHSRACCCEGLSVSDDQNRIGYIHYVDDLDIWCEFRDCNESLLAISIFHRIEKGVYKIDVLDAQNNPIGSVMVNKNDGVLEFFSADGRSIATATSFYTLWPVTHHGHWRYVYSIIDTASLEEVAVFSYHTNQNYNYSAWFSVVNRERFDATTLDLRVIALFMYYF